MDAIKVSIVIPVYNAGRFLRQCLDSVAGQTYASLEIICVNDGSTDDSLSILEEYAARDPRVKVFTKANEGRGAASARNLGMEKAAGKYIMFLDADDFFEPDMVEACAGKMERTGVQVCVFKANRFDNQKQKVTSPYVTISFDHVPKQDVFSYKNFPEHIFDLDNIVWNKMYRLDLLRQWDLRFEPIPISDDQYVPCLALLTAERLTVIDRAFVNYRFNTGHSQVDSYHKHPSSAYAAAYSIVKKMREYGIYEEVKKSYLNMAIRLLRNYFDHMTEYETIKFLYDKYRSEVFAFFEAEELTEDFFYDKRIYEWYRLIKTKPLEEILFMSARGFGNGNTTAVLRFQVPYDKIERGSRVVLVGKNIPGRYWYAQMLLSEYCDVVCWVDKESDIPAGLNYDDILTAR